MKHGVSLLPMLKQIARQLQDVDGFTILFNKCDGSPFGPAMSHGDLLLKFKELLMISIPFGKDSFSMVFIHSDFIQGMVLSPCGD